jgi:hypothetical protein
MQREDMKSAVVIATCVVVVGFILTALSVVSMRMAYRRAYTAIASSCQRVSLLTVENARYFCAPVARIEDRAPSGAPAVPDATIHL